MFVYTPRFRTADLFDPPCVTRFMPQNTPRTGGDPQSAYLVMTHYDAGLVAFSFINLVALCCLRLETLCLAGVLMTRFLACSSAWAPLARLTPPPVLPSFPDYPTKGNGAS